jgi:hypothetical protein
VERYGTDYGRSTYNPKRKTELDHRSRPPPQHAGTSERANIGERENRAESGF